MASNNNILRRPSDRNLFLAAAIAYPLLVFVGYFKTYYFSAFFDVKPIANALVHAHGIVMTIWVVYFSVQVALIRSKNVKLHMTLGIAGIVLAALVVIIGFATAWDSHIIRATAPGGINPHSFFIVPVVNMALFIVFFAGAIYYRKRPAEHKALMLLTALNFLPAAIGRIPVPIPPKFAIFWTYGVSDLMAISFLIWYTIKYHKLNKIFTFGVLLLLISQPLRIYFAFTETWLQFVRWIAS